MITSEQLQDDFRYLFPGEVQCLKRMVQSFPAYPVVVNIGAGAGTSGLAFMESRPDLTLITFDIEDKDSPFGSLHSEIDVLKRAGLYDRERYIPVKADSKTVSRDAIYEMPFGYAVYEEVDMVFIDGDHEYFACKGDILNWLPRIKPGGIMAVHDFEKEKAYARENLPAHLPHPMPWRGVDRAVRNYLCGKYEIIEHVDTLIAFRIQR